MVTVTSPVEWEQCAFEKTDDKSLAGEMYDGGLELASFFPWVRRVLHRVWSGHCGGADRVGSN